MEDDSIFRNRLAIDEKILKRLSKRAVTIANSFEALPEDQRNLQLQMLCAEISQYSFNLHKVKKMIEVNELEADYYRQKIEEMKQETASEYETVDLLKQGLVQEKIVVKNKEEYDRIAETINKYPTRSELQREIEVFQQEAASLVSKQAEVSKLIDHHKKIISENFASLNRIIDQITDDIKLQSK